MMTLLKLVSTQVPVSQGFADLVGFVNLASSLLDRAAVAPNGDSVTALEKNFKAMAAKVEEKLDIVEHAAADRRLAQGGRRLAEARLGRHHLRRAPQGNRRQPARAEAAG